jgi:hypothetical protein
MSYKEIGGLPRGKILNFIRAGNDLRTPKPMTKHQFISITTHGPDGDKNKANAPGSPEVDYYKNI